VDRRVGVEAGNERQQFGFAHAVAVTVHLAVDADAFAIAALVADIDFAGGIAADEDRGEAGTHSG